MRLSSLFKSLISILFLFLITSCGGEGGDTSPPIRTMGSISGYVFDAPVSGATVSVWEYNNGKLGRKLGQSITNPSGQYSISLDSSSMPLFVKTEGGAYRDPLTKNIVSISNGKSIVMSSVVNYEEGTEVSVMITPLTYQVAGLSEYYINKGINVGTAISNAIAMYKGMYGFDVNTTIPIDITTGGQSSFASIGHKYGALLVGYSSYSFDLIEKYPGNDSEELYTSYHLADIGYRDIVADGELNGLELDGSGLLKDISFGQVSVTSDLYSHEMAKYILIVTSDHQLNVSGTPVSDYDSFSRQINDLGTSGSINSVIAPRASIPIDEDPPEVTRLGSDTLSGTDIIKLSLIDEIGVDSNRVVLEWKMESDLDDRWTELEECSHDYSGIYCQLDLTNFQSGIRDTEENVVIYTESIDKLDTDTEDNDFVQSRLVIYAEDVIGNTNANGVEINFDWDNIEPVIEVISPDAIKSDASSYTLEGITKKNPSEIQSIRVQLGAQEPTLLSCSPINDGVNTWCKFSQIYSTDSFGDSTAFNITAEDILGNIGKEEFIVYKDDQLPRETVSYPDEINADMFFMTLGGFDASRLGIYSDYTYTKDTVDDATDILEINFAYASDGIASDISFSDFNVNFLKENNIPYIKVRVSDPYTSGSYGSSADKLTLRVDYFRKRTDGVDYDFVTGKTTVASTDSIEANIPHEALIKEADGRVSEVIYYIPFTKDVLGTTFTSTTENYSQKLSITVGDPSGNFSEPLDVYFRSTFDLPKLKVVTPFIGVTAKIEGMKANNDFNSLKSCTTVQVDSNSGGKSLDVAECEMTYNPFGYDFFRVVLQANPGAYYYQWESGLSARKNIDFNYGSPLKVANVGVYFSEAESQVLYIDELSTYQTSLFENQWNALDLIYQTSTKAKELLNDVNSALDTQINSFFGFNPALTQYATNEVLDSVIPTEPSINYQHRFLVESLGDMASRNASGTDSIDYAVAIYDDLLTDGKADGQGANGQIVIGNQNLNENIYRTDLAQTYFDITTTEYGVEEFIALKQADHFSLANPVVNGVRVFDSVGESIDKNAPTLTLSPDNIQPNGVVIADSTGNDFTISGIVYSTLTIEDIGGINTTDTAPINKVYWYAGNPLKRTDANIDFQLDTSKSNSYRHVYTFAIDSKNINYPNVSKFEIETEAQDIIGNNTGKVIMSSYFVDNGGPLITTATFSPTYANSGDSVNVTIDFSEETLNAKAKLGVNTVTWISGQNTTQWIGQVGVPVSSSDEEILTVSEHTDKFGNVGSTDTSGVLYLIPSITMDTIVGGIINESNAANVIVSGQTTRFDVGEKITVVLSNSADLKSETTEATVLTGGRWTAPAQDLSDWADGTITVTADGSNQNNIAAEIVSQTAQLANTKPTVISIISNPTFGKARDKIDVTANFSVAVSNATAKLGTNNVTWISGQDTSQWIGEVAIPSSSLTDTEFTYTVKGFTDTNGNLGDEVDRGVVYLTPSITIDAISGGVINEGDITNVVVSGDTSRFDSSQKVTLVLSNSVDAKTKTAEANVQGDGSWTMPAQNLTGWPDGEVTATVNGLNQNGIAAEAVTETAQLSTAKPTVSSVTLNPVTPSNGDSVQVTIRFNENVSDVSGTLDQPIDFSSVTAPTNEWVGTISSLNVGVESYKDLIVSADYENISGNFGDQYTEQVNVTPVIVLNIISGDDVVGNSDSGNLMITGTSTGFSEGDDIDIQVQSVDQPLKSFSQKVQVESNGTWSTTAEDISGWNNSDVIVTVDGINTSGISAATIDKTVTLDNSIAFVYRGDWLNKKVA